MQAPGELAQLKLPRPLTLKECSIRQRKYYSNFVTFEFGRGSSFMSFTK
jgi:hypothetical protein